MITPARALPALVSSWAAVVASWCVGVASCHVLSHSENRSWGMFYDCNGINTLFFFSTYRKTVTKRKTHGSAAPRDTLTPKDARAQSRGEGGRRPLSDAVVIS